MSATDVHRAYEFDGFRLIPGRRLLLSPEGEPLPVKARVFDTLLYFAEHPGVVIEKSRLMRAVWGDTVVEENGLNQHVFMLRRLLGEKRGENRFIATIPGRGFQFVASVRVLSDGEAGPQSSADTGRHRSGIRRWIPAGVGGAGFALLLVAAALWLDRGADQAERQAAQSGTAAETTLAEADVQRPARSTSPAARALYSEARTSWLAGSSPEATEKAQALLDRSIELDREFSSAYGLKARIDAEKLINSMSLPSVNPEERDSLLQRVNQFMATALELDASDPDALAARAQIDIFTWRWSSFDKPRTSDAELETRLFQLWILCWAGKCDEAVRIGEKIAALNPNDVDAHFGLGVAYAYAGNRTASIRSVSRALELAAGNPLGRIWLAYNEIALGKYDDALANLRLAEELAGDLPPFVMLPELAYSYSRIGHDTEAQRLFDRIHVASGGAEAGSGTWAMAYLAIGDEAQALEWLDTAARRAREHEPDAGFLHLMNLKMNFLADPRLEAPPFDEILSRIGGD